MDCYFACDEPGPRAGAAFMDGNQPYPKCEGSLTPQ
jgi:hypothetical protein